MDAAFVTAAEPEPFKIFGRKLKPFCIGHEFLLQRFGNSFAIESNAAPKLEHFPIAVFICSNEYRHGITLERFTIPLSVRMYSRFRPLFALEEMERFKTYIAENTKIPDFYSKGESDEVSQSGAPTLMTVKISLMSNLGFTEMEAMNMQLSSAFIHHLCWAEGKGHIQIIDDRERERFKAAKASEEKVIEMCARIIADAKKGAQPC